MHSKVPLLVAGSIAVAGIIYLATQPGGRLVPLAVLSLMFALVGAYYGFIRDDRDFPFYRAHVQTGAVVFFMLALALAYWSRQERGGIDQIAEWITPYPEIDQIMGAPRVSDEYLWMWIAETPDSMEEVVAFYQDKNNIGDWQTAESGRVFIFYREKYKLVIMLSRKHKGTGLLYKLSDHHGIRVD